MTAYTYVLRMFGSIPNVETAAAAATAAATTPNIHTCTHIQQQNTIRFQIRGKVCIAASERVYAILPLLAFP